MRHVLAIGLWLMSAVAFGQQPPVVSTIVSGTLTVKNVSNRNVLTFVIQYAAQNTDASYLAHDSYFKGHTLSPGEVMDMTDHVDPEAGQLKSSKVVFAQWVDGEQWGDADVAKPTLNLRAPRKQFYQSVLAAYQQQGESGLLARLKLERDEPLPPGTEPWQVFRGIAIALLGLQQQAGTATAVARVTDSLAAANSRGF